MDEKPPETATGNYMLHNLARQRFRQACVDALTRKSLSQYQPLTFEQALQMAADVAYKIHEIANDFWNSQDRDATLRAAREIAGLDSERTRPEAPPK